MKMQNNITQAERKHQAILDAAKKVFLLYGFNVTSMDEIAKNAGVSKRTVYDHFGNKEKLFEDMLSMHWQQLLLANVAKIESTKSIEISLKKFAKTFLDFIYQPETINIFRLLIGEANKFPNLATKLVINGKTPFKAILMDFFVIKSVKDQLCIDDPDCAAAYFMGLLKEYHFWPMMLGFVQTKLTKKSEEKLINDTVTCFLKMYSKAFSLS